MGKIHIYSSRARKVVPNINGYIRKVYDIENIEKYIAKKNNTLMAHSKKWLTVEEGNTNVVLENQQI